MSSNSWGYDIEGSIIKKIESKQDKWWFSWSGLALFYLLFEGFKNLVEVNFIERKI